MTEEVWKVYLLSLPDDAARAQAEAAAAFHRAHDAEGGTSIRMPPCLSGRGMIPNSILPAIGLERTYTSRSSTPPKDKQPSHM